MKNLLTVIDPQTYGFNRSAIALGIVVLVVAVVVCNKMLAVLHAAGLPSAS
jgi:hypothetical protein